MPPATHIRDFPAAVFADSVAGMADAALPEPLPAAEPSLAAAMILGTGLLAALAVGGRIAARGLEDPLELSRRVHGHPAAAREEAGGSGDRLAFEGDRPERREAGLESPVIAGEP
jgi:hypothetical protein